MQSSESKLKELVQLTVLETVKSLGLESANPKPKQDFNERTAYQKTEQILYMYNKFKSIVEEAERTILEYQTHGVPQRSSTMGERVQTSRVQTGIVLPEESVEAAVRNVQHSVERTVRIVTMVEDGLKALQIDPWYEILPMLYFEGRTQEDIASHLHTTQKTISKQKTRLVRELALQMFPDQVIDELLS